MMHSALSLCDSTEHLTGPIHNKDMLIMTHSFRDFSYWLVP